MDQHPTPQDLGASRRQPEFKAAVFNGGLILLVPVIWSVYLVYTDTAVHPSPPTLLSSAVAVLPALFFLAPVAILVAWRTYVHARAYRLTSTLWRGPVESTAIGGGIALMIMIPATAGAWAREPFYLVIVYNAFYVGATAVVGLVLGLILAATAVLVIHLQT